MKKLIMPIVIVLMLGSSTFFTSCVGEAIDALQTFTFQLPLLFDSDHFDKAAPDTSWEYSDLTDYKEYSDNEGRIKTAQILHFNYWIDSLQYKNLEDSLIYFDPSDRSLEFERISFDIIILPDTLYGSDGPFYGKSKSEIKQLIKGGVLDQIIVNTEILKSMIFTIGEFFNVNVADYYRNPEHIIEVPEQTALIISDLVKNNPQFAIRTSYTTIKGQTREKFPFPYINARYDMVIRFEVEI